MDYLFERRIESYNLLQFSKNFGRKKKNSELWSGDTELLVPQLWSLLPETIAKVESLKKTVRK